MCDFFLSFSTLLTNICWLTKSVDPAKTSLFTVSCWILYLMTLNMGCLSNCNLIEMWLDHERANTKMQVCLHFLTCEHWGPCRGVKVKGNPKHVLCEALTLRTRRNFLENKPYLLLLNLQCNTRLIWDRIFETEF